MENSNKNKDCEYEKHLSLKAHPSGGGCHCKIKCDCPKCSPLIPKSEEKKCTCGGIMGLKKVAGVVHTFEKCTFESKAPSEVKPYNLECGKCNRTYKGAELEEPCPFCLEVKPSKENCKTKGCFHKHSEGSEYCLSCLIMREETKPSNGEEWEELYDVLAKCRFKFEYGREIDFLKEYITKRLSHSKTLILEEVEKKKSHSTMKNRSVNSIEYEDGYNKGIDDALSVIKDK
jgi:hypothetical protein